MFPRTGVRSSQQPGERKASWLNYGGFVLSGSYDVDPVAHICMLQNPNLAVREGVRARTRNPHRKSIDVASISGSI